jgi:hypothetical protein
VCNPCVSYFCFSWWVTLQVKPELDVLDYHTEFSGITKEALLPVRLVFSSVRCCEVWQIL